MKSIAQTSPDHGERDRRQRSGSILFRSGRQFAAWLGLTPRAHSSGGKERRVGISKMGDGYLRRLLVVGATAVLHIARRRGGGAWGCLKETPTPRSSGSTMILVERHRQRDQYTHGLLLTGLS
jgi:transposase